MRAVVKSAPSDSCRILFFAALLASLCFAQVFAQKTLKPSPPKYLQTEVRDKGNHRGRETAKEQRKRSFTLLVKNGAGSIDVYLYPKSFFEDMGMGFNKGDEITLTGSNVRQGETDLVLAREVVKGNNTFLLRHAKIDKKCVSSRRTRLANRRICVNCRTFLSANDLKSSDHIPVAALGIVSKLLDRVPGRYTLDASLFGRNMPIARYDERSGVTGHCTPKGASMLPQEHLRLGVPCSTPSYPPFRGHLPLKSALSSLELYFRKILSRRRHTA